MHLPFRYRLRIGRGAIFRYPAGAAPRTIVLSPGFREAPNVRCVADPSAPLQSPVEALAGTLEQLRRAASQSSVTPSRGIVVFAYENQSPLSEEQREFLWRRFEVPIFEQYLSADNNLLATECDAHAGLHIAAPSARREGFATDSQPCPCGDPRPRLVPVTSPPGRRHFSALVSCTSDH